MKRYSILSIFGITTWIAANFAVLQYSVPEGRPIAVVLVVFIHLALVALLTPVAVAMMLERNYRVAEENSKQRGGHSD